MPCVYTQCLMCNTHSSSLRLNLTKMWCMLALLNFLIVNCRANFEFDVVYPRIIEVSQRRRRDINSNVYYEEEGKSKIVQLGDWVLELDINPNLLIAPKFSSQWISSTTEKHQPLMKCDYKRGVVQGLRMKSTVAMTLCGSEVTGFILIPGVAYFVQPLNGSTNSHIMYKSRRKRAAETRKWDFFNLTGDTIEIDGMDAEITPNERDLGDNGVPFDKLNHGNNSVKWWREQDDSEEFGYFFDTAWEVDFNRHGRVISQSSLPTRWLEIAVAIDHTVIAFHGRNRVEQYVLALMNIVSAIYQDSSLEANLQMVITRLLLYENKKQTVVRAGNAKKSLENVNAWNRRLHLSLAPGEPKHDVAVWLTRSDIGGPSGYAPVGGVCDPKRSCALNRDEGLTSAFIIAHEMAHILGLSHDGDKKLANDCGDEALDGSIMAPMVSATFHKFTWSQCSRKEYKTKFSKWTCLQNPPQGLGETILNATIDSTFSMDEQCRMEFGEGFQLCRAFDIIEPCSHLWCGHVTSPLVCKTKKGPPLEGTECGLDKWCINGYCEHVDKARFGVPPVLHNPLDGGWGNWSSWGPCSRSCGTGVRFRARLCNNPEPAYGGENCPGKGEEWHTCNTILCPEPIQDIRAQQCRNIVTLLNIQDAKINMTWLPFESEEAEIKCQLICISKQTRELFVSGENLLDGSPCTYDNSSNICIQGKCQELGCDGKLFTKAEEDLCGICGGNNSDCSRIITTYQKRIKKEVSRVSVIPRLARNIELVSNLTMEFVDNPTAAFILKNRMRKKYAIPIPSSVGIHAEIIEGAKFYYKKVKGVHRIWAKGPLLAEMVVLLYTPKNEVNMGLNISLSTQYYLKNSLTVDSTRFSWILGGWGPCSASCGGGRRQKTVACWDTQNSKIVRRKFCSLTLKPILPTEVCNTYSCHFHWITGEWEPCSVTCGSYGLQSRELYCVPQTVVVAQGSNSTKMDGPWRYMVNPNRCAGVRPISVRPCYRIPCPSYWEHGEWSQCSATCGAGISVRSVHCPPPEGETFFTCGVHPAVQRRVCRGPFTRHNNTLCKGAGRKRCTEDKSKYCALPTLAKYCKLGSFKQFCCKSCSSFQLYPFSA